MKGYPPRPPKEWRFLRFWRKYPSVIENIGPPELLLPHPTLWFKPLKLVKPDDVKVIIVDKSPSPVPGVSNGLAYSADPTCKRPLYATYEIFRELRNDLQIPTPRSGDLTPWAERGVLLLNESTTVPKDGGRHARRAPEGKGWEYLTYEIIRLMGERHDGLVFCLWGKFAQGYKAAIDLRRHLVISSDHPGSPASDPGFAFRGSKPFSKARDYNPRLGTNFWRL